MRKRTRTVGTAWRRGGPRAKRTPLSRRDGTERVLGEVTLGDLEDLVRLACFVTPRSDDEQLLLAKAALALSAAGGADLRSDVQESASFSQHAVPVPEHVGGIVTAAAVGTAVFAGVKVLSRRRTRAVEDPPRSSRLHRAIFGRRDGKARHPRLWTRLWRRHR